LSSWQDEEEIISEDLATPSKLMAYIFYAQMNGEAIDAVQSGSGYKEETVDEDVEDNFEVPDHCSFAGLFLPDVDGVDNISSSQNSRS
jgi:hypothetical protein